MPAYGSILELFLILFLILFLVVSHYEGEAFSQSNAAVGRQWDPAYQTAGRGFRHVAPKQRPSHGS